MARTVVETANHIRAKVLVFLCERQSQVTQTVLHFFKIHVVTLTARTVVLPTSSGAYYLGW